MHSIHFESVLNIRASPKVNNEYAYLAILQNQILKNRNSARVRKAAGNSITIDPN